MIRRFWRVRLLSNPLFHSISGFGRTLTLPGALHFPKPSAFTLVELLVVIVIIGILASIAVPSLRGLGEANIVAAANRQLLDALSLARLRAINERSTVYLVFVPPNISGHLNALTDPRHRRQFTNLYGGQFAMYSLLAERSVGDQPGRKAPRYLTEWKTLPARMLFDTNKFNRTNLGITDEYYRAFPVASFPFPTSSSPALALPYLAFDSQGRLVSRQDEVVAVAQGTVLYARAKNGQVLPDKAPDVVVTPPNNHTNNFIRINWLTGRATSERIAVR